MSPVLKPKGYAPKIGTLSLRYPLQLLWSIVDHDSSLFSVKWVAVMLYLYTDITIGF